MEDDIYTKEELTQLIERNYLFEPIKKVKKLPWIHKLKEAQHRGCSFSILAGEWGPYYKVVIN